MTLKKFRILCLIVFFAIYISAVSFLPNNFLNIIFCFIAGWQIGGWMFDLSDKLAVKYGYTEYD